MNEQSKAEAYEHARREYPRESCGLVVNVQGKERYFACRNIAERAEDFILDPEDYAKAEDLGDIMAVVHSHPDVSANPSQADRVSCEASGLPWLIVAYPVGLWVELRPEGYTAPLIGRQFSHGVLDCYTLVRDWYKLERGVELLDFERRDEWWNKGQDLYIENFAKTGFVSLPDGAPIEPGDVIFMQIRSNVVNHAAIYLGNDQIIHHLQNRLSCRDIYGGFWRKNTRLVVRFKGIP